MGIKDDVLEFLGIYSDLSNSKLTRNEDIICIELSPAEKKKHLLSQVKFSFSKDVCQERNAELLTPSNEIYLSILDRAKGVGVVTLGKSFEVYETTLMLNYLVELSCQNHKKEDIGTIYLKGADLKPADPVDHWSEAEFPGDLGVELEELDFGAKLRDNLVKDISEIRFKFEDEMERRKDRERSLIHDYYTGRKRERRSAARRKEKEIRDVEERMKKTASMRVYNTCKKELASLENAKNKLDRTEIKDLNIIDKEYKNKLKEIDDRYAINTQITLLNAVIVVPTKP